MNINSIISNHDSFKEKTLTNRFFKHNTIVDLLNQLPPDFDVKELGKSVKGKSINLVKCGKGKIKVMLWSQMHGDEATGTMALFDLFNFLQSDAELAKLILESCELYILPMVNPDGAEVFTRRNAQQIDINRDFLKTVSSEARLLKQCRDNIKPDFGFNLHDQQTLWSVTGTLKPATLSFLAPAFDQALNINETRKNAMLVIADMFNDLDQLLPKHIGLFDDEFEPRAFGDNFQKAGTSTILIEAGGYTNDYEKQEIRRYYFAAILAGLNSIATKKYPQQDLKNYFAIPKNNKQIFHILIQGILIDGIEVSIGINYDECPTSDGCSTFKTYSIQDIGDLSFCDAYQIFSASSLSLNGKIVLYQNANFELLDGGTPILSFENGTIIFKKD
ncbi:M14 family zinc carboxypeptidase [Pedobacter boryungensis]|uniref:Succinylglutamate desuccinylase/aspartoacylase family protein n=1 Tax=Pedobacter boryungensis TaxID=869962 RepID=A0ABX2DBX1_9SPHI|nr:M14 family zinc carboxypeptidase [Pedobacter boryungensis]NQX30664.1 succinylglutamate desuccinylase/aspartoacylase family protein [Pedobacter boryungensis]